MSINDGGAAFPADEKDGAGGHFHSHLGMSLRDYFAGQVLTGCVNGWTQDPGAIKEAARRAYLLADAMIVARELP